MNTNIGPQTPPPRARVVRYVYEAGRPRVPVLKSSPGLPDVERRAALRLLASAKRLSEQ